MVIRLVIVFGELAKMTLNKKGVGKRGGCVD
jgi:hypothetical protein